MKQLIFLVLFSYPVLGSGQLIHTMHFTQQLESFQSEFIHPVEAYFHAQPKRPDEFHSYDLVLVSDDEQLEFRYVFIEEKKLRKTAPQIYVSGRLTSAATNDESAWVYARTFREDEARAYYGADWAFTASFEPKDSFSEKSRARLYAIYNVGTGLILTYSFYDEEEEILAGRGNQIRFVHSEKEE